MPSAPIILSQNMMDRAINDPAFFSSAPEYGVLRGRNKKEPKQRVMSRGCGGCKGHKTQQNLFKEFITITAALNPNAQQRLKKYFGAEQLMMNTVDPVTHGIGVRII